MSSGLWKLCSSWCLFTLGAAEPQAPLSDSQGVSSSRITVSLQIQEWVTALHASPGFPLICLFLELRLRPRMPSPPWTLLCYLQGLSSALPGGGCVFLGVLCISCVAYHYFSPSGDPYRRGPCFMCPSCSSAADCSAWLSLQSININ